DRRDARDRGRAPMREHTVARGAYGVAIGPDGVPWFTVAEGDRVGRLAPGGEAAYHELAPGSQPTVIIPGPDGALWFTEYKADRIGRLTVGGELSEIRLPPGAGPYGLAAAPDGAIWFTETGTDHIGRITSGGEVTRLPIGRERCFPSAI